MLIIYVRRWTFQPARFEDNELPLLMLEEQGMQPAWPWRQPQGGCYAWGEADDLPLLGIEDPPWQPALVWPEAPKRLYLWGEDEALSPHGLEESESSSQPVRNAVSWTKALLWPEDDALPLLGLEESVWQSTRPGLSALSWSADHFRMGLHADEEWIPAAVPIAEDQEWTRPLLWSAWPLPFAWGDEGGLPDAANFFLDEDAWLSPGPWGQWPVITCPIDADALPLLGLEEPDWQAPLPWSLRWNGLGFALGEEILPQLGVDEEAPALARPWALPWHRSIFLVDDQEALEAFFGFLAEEGFQPARPWPQRFRHSLWIGEDEYPTPLEPFFLDEEEWVPRLRIWPAWYVFLGQYGWGDGQEGEFPTAAQPYGRRLDLRRASNTRLDLVRGG
jgi:hypothetical protein